MPHMMARIQITIAVAIVMHVARLPPPRITQTYYLCGEAWLYSIICNAIYKSSP